MPVSSVLIRTAPVDRGRVTEGISALRGASIAGTQDDRIVAVIETESRAEDKALWAQMQSLPGVIALNLIYHNFEDLAEVAP